jgi:superfamily II DNA or RNA helicase
LNFRYGGIDEMRKQQEEDLEKKSYFEFIKPQIYNNPKLRIPQKEGYSKIYEHYSQPSSNRETAIVLPVGCGKSGLITITPFAVKAKRVLVIAPGLRIKKQLADDFDVSNPKAFYRKCNVVDGNLPESSIIDGKNTNINDLKDSEVVVTNIQQIQGDENKWLVNLPNDFFDVIIIDEAHHNVADSWERIKKHFPYAKIINLSATPVRADGKIMTGEMIYSFSIVRAIENGYVKRLKAKVLSPATLRYIRNENGQEVAVTIEEIRKLGEEDSKFRRGIVSSPETLNTIIDCSIKELQDLRERSGDNRHKIIASALNYEHCIQITEAYRARSLRADYIHSQEDSVKNKQILEKLENHQLDVIVQVKMLGEGFDHPYLSVAAVCSVFSNLTPFAQFVGRIMRVIDQNSSSSLNNQGIVVFHAGSNVAQRWQDFQNFSQADQEYFNQLLPVEEVLDFSNVDVIELNPVSSPIRNDEKVEIIEQEDVYIEELDLYKNDVEVQQALAVLKNKGLDVVLKPIQISKQNERQAAKNALDDNVKNIAGKLLGKYGVNHEGKELDKKTHSKTNFIFIKSLLDNKINRLLGIKSAQRGSLSLEQIQIAETKLDDVMLEVEREVFINATS